MFARLLPWNIWKGSGYHSLFRCARVVSKLDLKSSFLFYKEAHKYNCFDGINDQGESGSMCGKQGGYCSVPLRTNNDIVLFAKYFDRPDMTGVRTITYKRRRGVKTTIS